MFYYLKSHVCEQNFEPPKCGFVFNPDTNSLKWVKQCVSSVKKSDWKNRKTAN